VIARYIHHHSPRSAASFVAINCAAIPENLLEATLFGYEKGAFTGAQSGQPGKFEQAQGGVILLDEISEMPLGLQVKLLRVLQEREVERVGGKKPISLDIRVLATSNRDMEQEIARGRFREDLYYRLNVFPLLIPPLRERPDDIVPLARHFLVGHAQRAGRQIWFSPEAEALLRRHNWPGNVRELENATQRALILTQGDTITTETLHLCLPHLQDGNNEYASRNDSLAPHAATEAFATSSFPDVARSFTAANSAAASANPVPHLTNMRDFEREHILATLREMGGSRKKTVEKLGISERTLRYKLQQYREEGYEI